jgi:hypothetical protein
MYANDNRGSLPFTGWGDGPNWGGPNPVSKVPCWAYDGNLYKTKKIFEANDIQTGALWPYAGKVQLTTTTGSVTSGLAAIFRCPLDVGPWSDPSWYTVMTTYCANGCMGGWGGPGKSDVPSRKISDFKAASAAMYWEVGATSANGAAWDAANGPYEDVTVRHAAHSTSAGYLDGHANLITKDEFINWCRTKGGRDTENPVYCMPDPGGGGTGGFASQGIPNFIEN